MVTWNRMAPKGRLLSFANRGCSTSMCEEDVQFKGGFYSSRLYIGQSECNQTDKPGLKSSVSRLAESKPSERLAEDTPIRKRAEIPSFWSSVSGRHVLWSNQQIDQSCLSSARHLRDKETTRSPPRVTSCRSTTQTAQRRSRGA